MIFMGFKKAIGTTDFARAAIFKTNKFGMVSVVFSHITQLLCFA
jgi:hypothetical protein